MPSDAENKPHDRSAFCSSSTCHMHFGPHGIFGAMCEAGLLSIFYMPHALQPAWNFWHHMRSRPAPTIAIPRMFSYALCRNLPPFSTPPVHSVDTNLHH